MQVIEKDIALESDTQFLSTMIASGDDLGGVDCGPSQPKLASFQKAARTAALELSGIKAFDGSNTVSKKTGHFALHAEISARLCQSLTEHSLQLAGTLGPRLWKQIEGYESMMHAATIFFL